MKNKLITTAIATILFSGTGFATTGSVNGFGTIGAASNSNSNMIYGDRGTLTNGVDVVGESKFGIQADLKLNDKFSITAQAVAKGKDTEADKIAVSGEWLFGSYTFNDSAKVRFGQLRLPLFMNSEKLDIGKSYALAKLPLEMYGQSPTNTYQGVDALFNIDIDDNTLTIQPYIGTSRFSGRNTLDPMSAMSMSMPDGTQVTNTFEANSITGINVQYTAMDERLKLRAGYMQTNLDDKGGMTLQAAMNPGMAGFAAHNVNANFKSVGVAYQDKSGFGLNAEYGQRRVDSAAFPDTDGYYVALTQKIANFTPYVSYSAIDSNHNKIISGTKSQVLQQNTVAAGLGYDIDNNSNIKAEISQVSVGKDNNSNYYSANSDGSAVVDKSFNVYRLNYNILF
jgi:hypothetical protein